MRNWASFETPNGKPMFRMKSQPDPDFTPEQRAAAAKAAGVVVSCDTVSRDLLRQDARVASRTALGHPPEQDDAPAAIVGARSPEAA